VTAAFGAVPVDDAGTERHPSVLDGQVSDNGILSVQKSGRSGVNLKDIVARDGFFSFKEEADRIFKFRKEQKAHFSQIRPRQNSVDPCASGDANL
jgi:hypothetical protein